MNKVITAILLTALFVASCGKSGTTIEDVLPLSNIDSVVVEGNQKRLTLKGEELEDFYDQIEDALFFNSNGIKEGVYFFDFFLNDGNRYTGKSNAQYFGIDKRAIQDTSLLKGELNFELTFEAEDEIEF